MRRMVLCFWRRNGASLVLLLSSQDGLGARKRCRIDENVLGDIAFSRAMELMRAEAEWEAKRAIGMKINAV